jgi:hypothetical protein
MPNILDLAKLYYNQVLAVERYLGMSVTTKATLLKTALLSSKRMLMELGILGRILEWAITKMRQKQIARHLRCVQNFATRELIKTKEEVQIKSEKVQAKVVKIKEKSKQGPLDANEVQRG